MNSKAIFVLNEKRVSCSHRKPRGRERYPSVTRVKQVLAFLWSMGNQEPARAVTNRFNITMSSVNRILIWLSQAAVVLSKYTCWGFSIFTLKYLFYSKSKARNKRCFWRRRGIHWYHWADWWHPHSDPHPRTRARSLCEQKKIPVIQCAGRWCSERKTK